MVRRLQPVKWIYVCLGVMAILLLWNISILLDYRNIFSIKFFAPSATVQPNLHTYMRPENDYTKLIDLQNFSFQRLEFACNDTNVMLLILIHSSPENVDNRKVIRETWGQKYHEVKTLFLLGDIKDDTIRLRDKLEEESLLHRDLVQGNFIDSYRNLTYKHVMTLKYAIYHCPHAKFVLKTDDNVFVNVLSLVKLLRREQCPLTRTNLLLCRIYKGMPVIRNGKWGVTLEEYPNKIYPTCCAGHIILYSRDITRQLYNEAQTTPYFWIDDVYVTGILAQKANVVHTDSGIFTLSLRNETKILNGIDIGVATEMLFGTINLKEKEIRALWDYVRVH